MSQYDIKDPRVIQMMRERGIYHPALVTKAHSRKGNAESRIMDEIMSQVAKEDQVQQQLNARQEAQQLALSQQQSQFDQSNDQRKLAREGLAADKEKGSEDRRALTLTHVLSDPDATPEEKQAIRAHMLKQAGVTVTKPVDPGKAALARSKNEERAKQGLPSIPEPSATPQTAGATGYAPEALSYREGTPTIQRNVDAGQVVGSLASQIPAGKDLNFNTGELVDSNMEGTINGRPARTVVAEGALKTGVSPEDTRSRELYNTMRSNPSLATDQPKPTMTANQGAQPAFRGKGAGSSFAPSDLADQTRPDITPNARPGLETAKALATGFGEGLKETADTIGVGAADYASKASGIIPQGVKDFATGKVTPEQQAAGRPDILPTGRPTLFGGGQGAQELVGTPNTGTRLEATPAPGSQQSGPFSGSIGQITTPPQPQSGLTPPAIPPVARLTPEEEEARKRQLATQ